MESQSENKIKTTKTGQKINFFQKMEIKWQEDVSIQVDRKKEKTP